MTYRFREAREKAGLSTLEVAKRIGVSQSVVTYWDNGTKPPSIETLCKLADLYCVSTDYLLGRDEPMESIPRKEDVIATETLRALNGKPVWHENKVWGIVNSIHDYVIFMDGWIQDCSGGSYESAGNGAGIYYGLLPCCQTHFL